MGKGYYYFETPDYDDCHKKVFWATKYAFIGGSLLGAHDILFSEKARTLVYCSGKMVSWTVPITATLALGASLQCALANMRGQKDDCWNYFWAGCATGVIWGHKWNSGAGAGMGLLMGTAGALLKKAHQEDWVVWPDIIDGNVAVTGSYGHHNWGDLRVKDIGYQDPGRRPL